MKIFKKSKKIFKVLSMIMAMLIIAPSISAFAVEIDSTDGESYLNYDSPTWGKVLPIGNHRYYTPDLKTCYCLNTGALNPTGQDYTEEMNVDKGIETILYWGYPAKNGSDWGISADEYRYCTQLAIWSYQKEAGISRGLVRSRLQDGTVSLSKLKPVIDFLVDKAHNRELPDFFNVTPTEVNAKVDGDYLVSEPIKIKSDYSFSNARVIIKSISDPSLKDKIKIIDSDGDERDLFNSNESFRVEIPKNAKTGDLNISIKAMVDIPSSVAYETPVEGKQDMAVVPLETTPQSKDKITVRWTALAGRLEVTKKDNDGNLLDGAKFELKDSTGKVVATQISKSGKINFENLTAGDYTLVEVEAPQGYVPVEPQKVTINPNATTKIDLTDNKIKGKVAVKKVDKESNSSLEGAEFTIYDNSKNAVATITTDKNGYAESGLLNYGTYTMKETKAPKGFLLNEDIFDINISENGKTYTFEVPDQIIKGKIQVLKVDEETNKPLQGAEFEILKDGQQITTITTNEKGIATSGLLPFGDYVVKEIKSPDKYVLNGKEYPVTISENGKTIEITHTNRIIKGKVAVKKTDNEIPSLNLEGAEFTIYDNNKNAVATITTDKNGYAESGLLNYGTYTMKETKAPKGFLLNDKTFDINITEDGKVYNYDITNNVIKGKIQIVKVDSENEEKPVEGAGFDVIAKDVLGVKAGTIVDHVVTDKDGFAYTKDLRFGEYEFKEVKTPAGYWQSDKIYNMNITENGKTYVRYVKNAPIQAKLRVVKKDGFNNKPLKGAEFQIRNLDNNKIVIFKKFVGILPIPQKTFKTDENGEFITPQVLPYGHYQLEEVGIPEGYVGINPIKFTVDEKANLTDIKDLGTILTIDVDNNRITSNMELLKVDSETKKPLSNVKFTVECLDGFMKGQKWDLTSDEKGKINLKDLQYGHYQITEVKTLWNYVLNDKPVQFDVKENGKTVSLEMTNKKIRGSVEVLKLDKDTNRPLENVEFKLFNGEKEIGTYKTDENGKITVNNLEAGNYYWQEVEAPEHYNMNDKNKYDFTISKDGQLEKITVNNTVKTGSLEFSKIDVSTGKVIDGAKIQITGLEAQNKHINIEFTSSKEGNKFTLPEGKYQFKEVTAPTGYKLNEEVGNFEIKDGQVTKAQLKDERKQGNLEFSKIDVSTGNVIDGAKIKITCVEGLSKGKVIEFTSSKEGNKFTLDEGKYTFQETTAPTGYKLNEEVGNFEIKDGQVTKAQLKDERKQGNLEFSKIDVSTGNIIDGAKIKITCVEGLSKGKVIEFTSSKEGNKFTLDEGKYTFQETTAPTGYKLNEEIGNFEIKDGQVTKAQLKDERKQGNLEFSKIDVSTGNVIDGAKIKITCVEGLSKGKVIEFTSSKEGNKFTLDEGKYTFQETISPDGYNLSTEIGNFEIKDGQVTKAQLKNERTTGKLIFKKTDSKTGEGLDGAEIKLVCTDGLDKGKEITFTSKKEGNELTLLAGKYTISEIKAPDGYKLTEEKASFEITKEGQTVKCNLNNTKFEIVKTGSNFNINMLIPMGVILILGALIITVVLRKRKRA
ncbi:SpaA isopeptide-forming pilin-related protein [Clostridium perfringens]|uniref:SpaA isopeptide-forming pilin-related protein n=1 Tax=Clostridium perfringens TaxID=1502 RepID=UPI0024BC5455